MARKKRIIAYVGLQLSEESITDNNKLSVFQRIAFGKSFYMVPIDSGSAENPVYHFGEKILITIEHILEISESEELFVRFKVIDKQHPYIRAGIYELIFQAYPDILCMDLENKMFKKH